jgi:hypothetical protein
MKFTPGELEIIKQYGRPKASQIDDRPFDIRRAEFELGVLKRYTAWLQNEIREFNSVDTTLDAVEPEQWSESNEILNKFKR